MTTVPHILAASLILLPSLLLALNSDGTLLLAFKYSILSDPLSVLADWNYDDVSPCAWNGVMCMGFAGVQNGTYQSRVMSLVLPNAQLLGSIPPDIGLIEHLRHLDLSGNVLNGTIPATLFKASELRILALSDNEISGEIPAGVGSVSMPSLQVLNLSDNALTGRLPGNLSSAFPRLSVLSLANNYLYGEILPGRGFDRLAVLDLSSNLVNGSLPADFAGGDGVRYLNLSYNRLTGEIPAGFGSRLPANATVDLSFNNLTGEIPAAGGLALQKAAAFAGNQGLCGAPLKDLCPIPSTLSNPPPNGSTGTSSTSPPAFAAIPKTPEGGTAAAASGGGGRGEGGLRPAVIAAITAGDLAGIGLLLVVFLYVYQSKKKKQAQQQRQQASMAKGLKSEIPASISRGTRRFPWCWRSKGGEDSEETSEETTSSDETEVDDHEKGATGKLSSSSSTVATLVMVDGEMDLELETLLKASAYILGATGASIVYKAVLADGTALAVRRIGERSSIEKLKDFEAQVRSIAKHRHANLLRLRGFYWGADEKLLIHDYAPNGSLANISFTKKLSSSPYNLSFEARLRIARGVARGLCYIHEKKCIHGNIKPSNVLLGSDMEPMIGDFGIERLLSGDIANKGSSARHFGSKRSTVSQSSLPDLSPVAGASPSPTSSSSALLSQLPYQAPECLKNLKPSTKWDVYSFGVILLELISGRLFSEAELSEWNAGFIVEERNRVLRMADPMLRGEVQGKEEALLTWFKLGFACASTSPQRRPSMKEALQILDKIPSTSSSSATI
ncbi:hypothetical protein J5N97_026509 [Dioscorea zingiberensis]|uniref:Protein kinase domain-containing protein n=1 Tax=Dioscorea zingiberensis TaxID=325984 RepID=A0A9D5H6Q4_9LILI|nr:hypothetical protein J5N97_026509 [Dioscorea zingiberensis]